MRIEIWSDVVCPWCYIGKRRFEQALAGLPYADQVEVVFRSYELDPTAPEVPTESVVEALGRKYGGGTAGARQMMAQVAGVAAEAGLTFDFADVPHASTHDAHRLLHLALAEGGPALQARLKESLLAAYFTQGRSMGDHAVLREVAVAAGLAPDRVETVLASDEYAGQVAADIAQARAYGIAGVPFFVVDGKYGVSGAQTPDVLASVLDKACSDTHAPLQTVPAGDACGPDGCEA